MDSNFDKSLALVLKSEGKYVWDKRDPGGETMMGVTKGAWSGWLKRPIEDGEMIKLTVADITPFYKALYWDAAQCSKLPIGIDYLVFDSAVNMGVGRAVRLLQQSLGCVPDGVIGPNTMRAINATDVNILIDKFSAQKEQFYRSLKTFIVFGKGWLSRVEHVKQYAKDMLNGK
jgi:lysozyme family protein